MDTKDKDYDSHKEEFRDFAVNNACAKTVNTYGAANKEFFVAYTGVDNATGKVYKKSLKSISNQKINPQYQKQNIKQQSGYSAEVLDTAKENADKIVKGEKNKTVRTDDVGSVNDPLYDQVQIDENGNIISGSGVQMKFVGKNPDEALKKLASKDFQKYIDEDVPIKVPSDYYDDMKALAKEKIDEIDKQIANAKDPKVIEKLKERRERYKKIDKNLRKSNVSNTEAEKARLHPKLTTAENIIKYSHKAGLEGAKSGAIVGSTTSIIQNVVSFARGDIDLEEGVCNIAKDTTIAAATGYATSFSGSVLQGAMMNSSNSTIQALSKTNCATQIISAVNVILKTMKRYFNNEITGVECFEELGQNGVTMISSSVFAAIGQAALSSSFAILGGLIGSMVGYAIASASYSALLAVLKEKKFAHEERLRIEHECEEHIKMLREYRADIEATVSEYLITRIDIFHDSFEQIKNSLEIGDVDGFISGTNSITKALGKNPQFENMNEFNAIMNSDKKIVL